MKTIFDLTKKQVIEIAELIYPWPEVMDKVEVDFISDPPDPFGDDRREFIRVYFEAPMIGDRVFPAQIEIYTNLDCFASYRFGQRHNDDTWKEVVESIPTRNQYEVQKRFREWGIVPSQKNQRFKLVH